MIAIGFSFWLIFRRPLMVLKSAFAAALCTGLLMSGNPALADEYRAGELLGMDLSRAMLSPKRLGPEAEFAPVPIEARTDRKQVKTERVVVPRVAERKTGVVHNTRVVRETRVVQDRVEKPHRVERPRAARAKLAPKLVRRHSNPLDAQARDTRTQDTRIQTWPCKSGGICDWQR
ncbi:hypothetical protein ACFIOY_14910 [Bradyrhizobium sp. TZ2]|jgi:hypothetical protein